jgi:hypothetical protein
MSNQLDLEIKMICAKSLERYVPLFDRPETRLRFINRAHEQQTLSIKRFRSSIMVFPFIERTRLYRWILRQIAEADIYRLIVEELRFSRLDPKEEIKIVKPPHIALLLQSIYQWRFTPYVISLVTVTTIIFVVFLVANWSTRYFYISSAKQYEPINPISPTTIQRPAQRSIDTRYLPGYRPERIWLVEREENYEQYSNGVRILIKYETDNYKRAYYTGTPGEGIKDKEVRHDPVGIVYHSSESDLIPFTNENNRSIKNKTHALLEYIRDEKLYNYVIDRYGQIYRIVKDDQTAYHAGHSVWADEKNVYVGLNESFIGICFESNSAASDFSDQLTEAQIISGRLLTAVLRSRYSIEDVNCVTHGIVSVNPSNMLIGYHHDWITSFPFEAIGLVDKYKVPLPSIGEFGFSYDEYIVKKLGGIVWPGVSLAETIFKKRADSAKIDLKEFQLKERNRYQNYLKAMRNLRLEQTVSIK